MKRIPDKKVGLPLPQKDEEYMGSGGTFMVHIEQPFKEELMLKVPLDITIREWVTDLIDKEGLSKDSGIVVYRLTAEHSQQRRRVPKGTNMEYLGLRLWLDDKFGMYPDFFREDEMTRMVVVYPRGVMRFSFLMTPQFKEVREDALDTSEVPEFEGVDVISYDRLNLMNTDAVIYYRDLSGKLLMMERDSLRSWVESSGNNPRDFMSGITFTENQKDALVKSLAEYNGAGVVTGLLDYRKIFDQAVQKGNLDQISSLVSETSSLPKEDILRKAVGDGNVSMVEAMLKIGADVNTKTTTVGSTPLMYAAEKGHREIVELLLRNGADVNAKNDRGNTPLMYAASYGHREIVELLLRNGADVNTKTTTMGSTPLTFAASHGHREIVELLLRNGADVNTKNDRGYTPLMLAASHGHREIVELLLRNGADVNAKDEDGDSPLRIAAQKGHREIVELLLRNGADVNAKNNWGSTALTVASHNGDREVVELLLRNGADVNAKKNMGSTALTLAALNDHREVVELLLRNGADVNAKDKDGKTSLEIAFEEKNQEMVEILIRAGASFKSSEQDNQQ